MAMPTPPLGNIPVDKEFAKKLVGLSRDIKLSARGHVQVEGRGEHALEVELPFLQRVLGDFKLVPIVMGDQNYDLERALGVVLAKLIHAGDTLIVASSDLSHFHTYDDGVRLDHKVLRAIEEWDYFNMSRNFESRTWEACGGGPIVAAMIAAERLGAQQANVLKYANSDDVTSEKGRVVGYGAVALRDPRFTPVTVAELGLLEYEVSVLSPLHCVLDVKQIRVGQDGLVIKKGDYEGLLLPQVVTEEGWDRMIFLEQTCNKAGLPKNAWRDEDTDIFAFTAIVFGERHLSGAVTPEEPRSPGQRRTPGVPEPGSPTPPAPQF